MANVPETFIKDLQSVNQIGVDAVIGVIDIVESLHSSILQLGGLLGKSHRTQGITGMVYRKVRMTTRLAGKRNPPSIELNDKLPHICNH